MAKTSWLERNKKRAKLITKYADQRLKLKAIIMDINATPDAKDNAQRKMQAIPRNASPVRFKNRCQVSGRARGFVRRFGLSRIAFRELALEGKIPGVRKASW